MPYPRLYSNHSQGYTLVMSKAILQPCPRLYSSHVQSYALAMSMALQSPCPWLCSSYDRGYAFPMSKATVLPMSKVMLSPCPWLYSSHVQGSTLTEAMLLTCTSIRGTNILLHVTGKNNSWSPRWAILWAIPLYEK